MIKVKGLYILKQFNRSHLSSIFVDDKLKKFQFWQRLYLDHVFNLDHKKLSNFKDFF